MRFEIIKEGLFENDLVDLVLPLFSLDEYEAKIDKDAIVMGFFVKNKDAAADLSVFLERSAIEEINDVEVSSAPDEDSHYLVFIELPRNVKVSTISSILHLANHLCKIEKWEFQAYKLKKPYLATRKNVDVYLRSIRNESNS